MGKKSKRKKWSSGSEDNSRQRKKKTVQSRGPSEGEFSFSDVLSLANTVLYRGEEQELLEGSNLNLNLDTSVFSPGPQSAFDRTESMSQSKPRPRQSSLRQCLSQCRVLSLQTKICYVFEI